VQQSEWKDQKGEVKSDEPIDTPVSMKHSERYIELVISKPRFDFQPGQFVFLWIPSLSLLPHPFSLCSLPRALRRNKDGTTAKLSSSFPTAPTSSVSFMSTLMLPEHDTNNNVVILDPTNGVVNADIDTPANHRNDDDYQNNNTSNTIDTTIEMVVLDPTMDPSVPKRKGSHVLLRQNSNSMNKNASGNNYVGDDMDSKLSVEDDGVPSPRSQQSPSVSTAPIINHSGNKGKKQLKLSVESSDSSNDGDDDSDYPISGSSMMSILVKCMRPDKSGTFGTSLMTLAQQIQEHQKIPPFIGVYGPFGCSTISLIHYETCLLVAGGVGITPLLSHWLSMATMVANQMKKGRVIAEEEGMCVLYPNRSMTVSLLLC
jgi:hypothetical protein